MVTAQERYNLPNNGRPTDWNKYWLLKDPVLKAIRLKVAWKDIMCNERRHQFKVTDDPSCECCGQIETVSHQIWECDNARKLWGFCCTFLNCHLKEIYHNSIIDIVLFNGTYLQEYIKSITLKMLIQIDRSKSMTYSNYRDRCVSMLSIEKEALNRSGRGALAETISRHLETLPY